MPFVQVETETHSIGRVIAKIKIAHRTLIAHLIVMKNFTDNLILGHDVNRAFPLLPNPRNRRVYFAGEQIPYSANPMVCLAIMQNGSAKIHSIYTDPAKINVKQIIPHPNINYLPSSTEFDSIQVPAFSPTENALHTIFQSQHLLSSPRIFTYKTINLDQLSPTAQPLPISTDFHPNPKYNQFLNQFSSLFTEKGVFGRIKSFKHQIKTTTNRPVKQSPYPKTQHHAAIVNQNIQDLLDKGMIQFVYCFSL